MPAEHNLPSQRSLIVVTSNAIHLHSQTEDKVIFECESADGIVKAQTSSDNSGMLAIADSQIILLYDIGKERKKRHKLKGGDVSQVLMNTTIWHVDVSS
jgi:hypothetical protein